MEIWEFSKNLFFIFIILPMYIGFVGFIGFYLPINLIIKLYNFLARKIFEIFNIEIDSWILLAFLIFSFGFVYIFLLYVLAKIFEPLGNWSVVPIFIMGVVVYFLIKRIEKNN
ncbi:hypothetical protein [Staphylococcus caeli]|uniref:hypothetical protein n=1 Tax=Staphylococcus caeli TaxID=2201815 RepID=UPI003F571912